MFFTALPIWWFVAASFARHREPALHLAWRLGLAALVALVAVGSQVDDDTQSSKKCLTRGLFGALVLGLGVGVALLVAMTLSPILFTMMKQPRPWRTGAASKSQHLIDGLIMGIERLIEKHPWRIVLCFSVLFFLAIFGNTQLEIETRFSERFSEDNTLRIDEAYYNEQFERDFNPTSHILFHVHFVAKFTYFALQGLHGVI